MKLFLVLITIELTLYRSLGARAQRNYNPETYEKATQFISWLIESAFQNCEIFVAEDGSNSRIVETVGALQAGGQYRLNIWENVSIDRDSNVHKHTEQCSLVIIPIHGATHIEAFTRRLQDQLTGGQYNPLTRTDQDHYIFIAPEDSVHSALLTEFGSRVKYKLGIGLDLGALSTVCFFCLAGGMPEVVPISDLRHLFPDFTQQLNGRVLKIVSPGSKWRFEIEWRDEAYHPKRGAYKYWFDAAMDRFNFSYSAAYAYGDRGTGQLLKNGTWVGAMSDIIYKRADLGFSIGRTVHRNLFVAFSFPITYEWFIFVSAKPQTYYSWKAIFWPFSALTWLFWLLTLFVAGGFFMFVTKFPDGKGSSLIGTADYVIGSLFEQDRMGPVLFPYTPVKLFCSFWLLFSLVTSTAYRAKLVSAIAFPVATVIPETFAALAGSEHGIGLNYLRGAAYSTFKTSKDPVYSTIFSRLELYPDEVECLTKASRPAYSCILHEGIAEYANARNMSDVYGRSPLVYSKDTTLLFPVGVIMEKRALYGRNFDRLIHPAVDSGLVDGWIKEDLGNVRKMRWKYEQSIGKAKPVIEEHGPEPLVLEHFYGAFALLLGGILFSGLLFGYELIHVKLLNLIRKH